MSSTVNCQNLCLTMNNEENVIYKDDTTATINDQTEFDEAKAACKI